jgi:hypothetical protein
LVEFNRFIELDRRFLDVTELTEPEESALRSYTASLLGKEAGIGWADLLESRIVVILGEPGSGKTWELRNQAKLLKNRGFAFFIPLDRLVEGPLERALYPADERQFLEWVKKGGQVTFFLDSVDEGKFRKQQDFARALDSFVRGVGLPRIRIVRIVISSRVSEWRIHADREEIFQRFDLTWSDKQGADKSTTKTPEFRVVQLEPLDRSRVRKFAEEIGLENPKLFLEAIDIQHAWEFVRRPIDVADLISYWLEHGQLGTLSELIEFNLSKNLRETPERIQNDPLTPQLSRTGAECLGAAVIFCQRFNFFIPDTIPPADTSGALVAEQCLPSDWSSAMGRAMLSRAIFDAASYGRIRFHHRRIAEYVTASWLAQRMKEGCPYPVLENLLFCHHESRMIIRPSLRPVAAWLAIGNESWNRRLREHILTSAPDLFLTLGDPQSLPVEYKKSIIQNLIARYRGRQRIFLDADAEAMSRMANPALSPLIVTLLEETTTPIDIKLLLLQIIRHGRLRDCLDVALNIVESQNEPILLKSYAVAAIRDIGDKEARRRLSEISERFDRIENHLCALILEAIYPEAIGPQSLATLLGKTEKVDRYSTDLPWYLKKHLEETLPTEQAADMLQELLRLAQQPPHLRHNGEDTPISDRFCWLGEVIPVVLMHLMKQSELQNHEIEIAARALWILRNYRRYDKMNRDLPGEFSSLLDRYPPIRRAYFWICIEEIHRQKPDKKLSPTLVYDYYGVVKQREEDIHWLIKDIRESSSEQIKTTTLQFAVYLWHSSGRRRSIKKLIKQSIKGNRELLRLSKREFNISISEKFRHFLYRRGIYSWDQIYWKLKNKIGNRYSTFRDKIWLYRNLKNLRNGKAIYALSGLAREAASEDYHHWGTNSWLPLNAKRGVLIARAAATGWKVAWRRWTPPLPHEKPKPNETDCRVIIGLSGINISLADGELDFATMPSDEARLACRYAVNEMNGFPTWFSALAEHHPDAVRDVLSECVRGEWNIPADREHVHEVLSHIRYYGKEISPLVAEDILEHLMVGDPLHYGVLEAVLSILLSMPNLPRLAISTLAAKRLANYTPDNPRFILWMVILSQLESNTAMKKLKDLISQGSDPTDLIAGICAGLGSHSHSEYPLIENPDYLNAKVMSEFIPLVFQYVNVEEDIDRTHGGAYTPTGRDHAQEFRNGLIERFSRLPGREVEDVLASIAYNPLFVGHRDYILHLIDKRAEQLSESLPWSPQDIRDFMQEHETSPHSAYELFKIGCKRLTVIKDEVEIGEISSRYDLHPDDKEDRLRSWLARQLRSFSKGRYNVPQEEEIDLEQKPDLRIEAPGMTSVSIEVKWADNWSLNELIEGLADQLVGKYLRSPDSNYGIYVLGYKGEKNYWLKGENGQKLAFNDLVQDLQQKARELEKDYKDAIGLKVIDINFQRPT